MEVSAAVAIYLMSTGPLHIMLTLPPFAIEAVTSFQKYIPSVSDTGDWSRQPSSVHHYNKYTIVIL